LEHFKNFFKTIPKGKNFFSFRFVNALRHFTIP
jgi:hypothetical protein